MKTARLVVIGVALAAGLGAAYLVMGSKPEPVRVVVPAAPVETDAVLVAARDLSVGSVLTAEDLRWQPLPKEQVPQGSLNRNRHPTAFEDVKGRKVGQFDLYAGDPIRLERLLPGGPGIMSAKLPSGARAVAINIDEKGTTTAGNFIKPDDRVDVIRTFHAEDGPPGSFSSETILTNIRVLAIGQNDQEKAGERVATGGTATLELTPEQAEHVILAQRTSQLSLTLRSMADAAQAAAPTVAAQPPSMTIVRFGNASQARVR